MSVKYHYTFTNSEKILFELYKEDISDKDLHELRGILTAYQKMAEIHLNSISFDDKIIREKKQFNKFLGNMLGGEK